MGGRGAKVENRALSENVAVTSLTTLLLEVFLVRQLDRGERVWKERNLDDTKKN